MSLYMTIADYCLWGRLKQLDAANLSNNTVELKNRLRDAISILTIEEIWNNFKELPRNIELCGDQDGGLIE